MRSDNDVFEGQYCHDHFKSTDVLKERPLCIGFRLTYFQSVRISSALASISIQKLLLRLTPNLGKGQNLPLKQGARVAEVYTAHSFKKKKNTIKRSNAKSEGLGFAEVFARDMHFSSHRSIYA